MERVFDLSAEHMKEEDVGGRMCRERETAIMTSSSTHFNTSDCAGSARDVQFSFGASSRVCRSSAGVECLLMFAACRLC